MFETLMRAVHALLILVATAALSLSASTRVDAADCAGFTDVDTANPFCSNVEWVRNRSVTLGCTSATAYCPDDAVSRLSMAAFLNRLGTALTPTLLRVDTAPGAIDVDANAIVCQTDDFAVTGYPRRALVDLAFAGRASSAVSLAADIVQSADGGATWTSLNFLPSLGSAGADTWGGISDLGHADLEVGQNVRWGVRVSRGGIAGSADLSASRCQLRVLVHSRDGGASPL